MNREQEAFHQPYKEGRERIKEKALTVSRSLSTIFELWAHVGPVTFGSSGIFAVMLANFFSLSDLAFFYNICRILICLFVVVSSQ